MGGALLKRCWRNRYVEFRQFYDCGRVEGLESGWVVSNERKTDVLVGWGLIISM